MLIGLVGAAVLIALVYFVERALSTCPRCRRPWLQLRVGSRELQRTYDERERVEFDRHYDSSGRFVGQTARTIRVPTVRVYCVDLFRCSRCAYASEKCWSISFDRAHAPPPLKAEFEDPTPEGPLWTWIVVGVSPIALTLIVLGWSRGTEAIVATPSLDVHGRGIA